MIGRFSDNIRISFKYGHHGLFLEIQEEGTTKSWALPKHSPKLFLENLDHLQEKHLNALQCYSYS